MKNVRLRVKGYLDSYRMNLCENHLKTALNNPNLELWDITEKLMDDKQCLHCHAAKEIY